MIPMAQVKSRGTAVPTMPCLHGRHGNGMVGTAREWHGWHGSGTGGHDLEVLPHKTKVGNPELRDMGPERYGRW